MTERDPEVQDDIGQDEPEAKPESEPVEADFDAASNSDPGRNRPDQPDDFEAQVDTVDHDEAGA